MGLGKNQSHCKCKKNWFNRVLSACQNLRRIFGYAYLISFVHNGIAMSKSLQNARITILVGTLGQGGAERQLLYMLKAMHEMQMVPAVLSFTDGEHYQESITELGIPVYHVGAGRNRIKRLHLIRKIAKAHHADIMMSMHFYTNAYNAVVAKSLGVPSIGGIRGDYLDDIGPLGIFAKPSLRWPDVVAANSEQAIENAVTLGEDRSRLFFLPNVVNTDVFVPSTGTSPSPVLRLSIIGRIEMQKRFDRFLRLVKGVSTICPVEGRIYGKGTLQPEMERLAAELGLTSGQVRFMGPTNATLGVYHDTDIFTLTSDYEGTPNVILEAMSCGVPIVSTASGGVPTIVRNREEGLIVPVNNEEALLDAVVELVRNPEFAAQLGANARRRAVELYSVANLVHHLEKLFTLVFR